MKIFRIKSEVLHQNATIYVGENGRKNVVTDDGVRYSHSELEILVRSERPLPVAVHQIKKLIGGELIFHEFNVWKKDGSS